MPLRESVTALKNARRSSSCTPSLARAKNLDIPVPRALTLSHKCFAPGIVYASDLNWRLFHQEAPMALSRMRVSLFPDGHTNNRLQPLRGLGGEAAGGDVDRGAAQRGGARLARHHHQHGVVEHLSARGTRVAEDGVTPCSLFFVSVFKERDRFSVARRFP